MAWQRYAEVPLVRRVYCIPVYAIPVMYAVTRSLKACLIIPPLISLVLFLSTFWDVRSKLLQCYKKDRNGRHIAYNNEICKLKKETSNKITLETFIHQHCKYTIANDKVTKIEPKLDFTFSEYRKGLKHENYDFFLPNIITVPNPTFLKLFQEQCVTPLFCFQIFSSIMMCFDEYVIQSIFSTLMIIFVEAALVFARVSTISQFRCLENKSVLLDCKTKKDKEYSMQDSAGLRPGDLVRITENIEVPCDLLILEGACAVNEAMLSGESIPLPKTGVPDTSEMFNLKTHRCYVLFGGTRLEKVTKPLVCRVIRTAFDTEQGMLLNKMLSSEDIKYDPEALRFILMLSGLSLLGSILTFFYSKKTGYPLFIDIIVLFTNSIPFELPMEMGISVQKAVRQLMAKKIHCLEPFRITLAGKVDVCCFDKTGTLTDSKLILRDVIATSEHTNRVLASCHSLIKINGKHQGDPLDCAILKHLKDTGVSVPDFTIVKQYAFTSELKRQTVVASFADRISLVTVKGAPEAVEKLLKKVPREYKDYAKYAASGYRVIALACKPVHLDARSGSKLSDNATRTQYEEGLDFAGFVLLGCTLKVYAVEMLAELTKSGHRILMITGDNLLTAMNVAQQLKLCAKGAEGSEIDGLLEAEDSEKFFETTVFARADPSHKEKIIKKYKSAGFCTMMVGDGTNDVGALKAADVGVAMLDGPAEAEIAKPKQDGSLNVLMNSLNEGPAVKPGDASIAAPFTVKSNSLKSIIEIIQQGRTSLVTTIQMYKILALNSITNAFFLSFTDIIGIKFSEYQMLSVGILSAMAFQAISSGNTLPYISVQRPITTIFSRYILGSIAGQSIVHILAFLGIYRYFPIPEMALKFQPSLMNTALFTVSCTQTISTFMCNYIGRPFREDIRENNLMMLSLLGLFGFVLNVIFGLHEDINQWLEVLNLSTHLMPILLIVFLDSFASYAIEVVCFQLFML